MTPKRAPQRIALMTLVCILLGKHECAVLGNGTLAPLRMRPAGPAAREGPDGGAIARRGGSPLGSTFLRGSRAYCFEGFSGASVAIERFVGRRD